MTIYRVFHYTGRRYGEDAAAEYPTHYEFVADVVAENLEHAFQLTNHIDAPWTDNPEVTLPSGDRGKLLEARAKNPAVNSSLVLQRRSTSVGDIFVEDITGRRFVVASFGFTELTAAGAV